MIYSINLNYLKNKKINIIRSKNFQFYIVIITRFQKLEHFFLNSKKLDTFIDNETNSLVLKNVNTANDIYLINKDINNKLKAPYNKYFDKIKFSGKGFRLSSIKNKNILETFFGHSHITYMYLGSLGFKRLKKYKYIFWANNIYFLKKLRFFINNVKPVNFYTLRGLRPTKIKIIKRKGRKSPNL